RHEGDGAGAGPIRFTADGQRVAWGGVLLDTASGKPAWDEMERPGGGEIRARTLSPDGKRLAGTYWSFFDDPSSSLFLWDAATGWRDGPPASASSGTASGSPPAASASGCGTRRQDGRCGPSATWGSGPATSA